MAHTSSEAIAILNVVRELSPNLNLIALCFFTLCIYTSLLFPSAAPEVQEMIVFSRMVANKRSVSQLIHDRGFSYYSIELSLLLSALEQWHFYFM